MNTSDDVLLGEGLYRLGATAPVPPSDPADDLRRGRRRALRGRVVAAAGTALAVAVLGVAGAALGPLASDRAADPAGSPTAPSSTSVRQAESVVKALPSTFDLAINLLLERDAAEASVPDVIMRPLQEQTDESVTTWTAKAEQIDVEADQPLADAISVARRSLDALPKTRTDVRMQETLVEGLLAYSSLSDNLLTISTLVPVVGDAKIDAEIEALGHLRPAYESFGAERIIMRRALAEREVAQANGLAGEMPLNKTQLAELRAAEATWRRSLADFYTATSEGQRKALDEITLDTASDGAIGVPAHRAVNILLSNGSLDGVTLTPDMYTESCTELIRGLQEVSVAAADEVAADLAAVD